jgi:hypothetical protein
MSTGPKFDTVMISPKANGVSGDGGSADSRPLSNQVGQ